MFTKDYRVKSELGCFTIPIYEQGECSTLFAPQRAKQHFRTQGYRRRVFYEGTSHNSYRKVSADFNSWVRQSSEEGIQASGLQYETKAEAKSIEVIQKQQEQAVLQANNFTSEGQPLQKMTKSVKSYTAKKEVQTAYAEVLEQAPSNLQNLLSLELTDYEDKSRTTYIGIDDVCNKKQKSNRTNEVEPQQESTKQSHFRNGGKKNYKKRSFLFHTVAKIVTEQGNYTLTAPKISLIWASLMALLLHNKLLKTQFIFLVDGQITLHDFIVARMKWCPIKLLLDWYHLRKKVHMQFHKALKKSDQRDELMFQVEQYLWHGLLDPAIQLIEGIDSKLIKNQKELDVLIGYFKRNRALIPNYACRKKLGLVCSSNRVEKENDFIVSARQKRNGMSWTRTGSDALAIIATIQQNKELDGWLKTNSLSLKLAA